MGNLLTGQVLVGGASNFQDSGLANGISIDQVLATQVFKGLVKFPSLEVGVQVDEDLTDRYVEKRSSYDGPAQPRTPQNDPFALFRLVFGAPEDATTDYRSFVDKSSLDLVLGDFARLQPKLSRADQMLLAQHSDAIRRLELQLAALANCSAPTTPTGAGLDPTDAVATHKWAMTPANFPAVGQAMSDIVVQAIACGLTNVVTLMWTNAESDLRYQFLPQLSDITVPGSHTLSEERSPLLLYIAQWYAAQFGRVIDQLDAIPDSETGGSILDNSLLMWSSELGDNSAHLPNNVPVTLAGSNGGYFRTGRSVRFDDVWTPSQWPDPVSPDDPNATTLFDVARNGDQRTIGPNDRSNNDLLVSILNSFGLEAQTFGDPRFCKGPLPGLAK
jgi:hypothetical protein